MVESFLRIFAQPVLTVWCILSHIEVANGKPRCPVYMYMCVRVCMFVRLMYVCMYVCTNEFELACNYKFWKWHKVQQVVINVSRSNGFYIPS